MACYMYRMWGGCLLKQQQKNPEEKKMAPNIIAFSTITKRQLRYKQMLMTYKQYNTQVF